MDVYLEYDPDCLEAESATAGTTFSTVLPSPGLTTPGLIGFSAGKLTPPFPSGTFTVVTITFKAMSVPTTSTQITFSGKTLVDLSGYNITGILTGATRTITATTGALTVSGISPSSGPLEGGTTVAITGTGLVNGATVTIGGSAATDVTFVNSTSMTATTPAGTAGVQDVEVTNPDTQSGSLEGGFTYAADGSGNGDNNGGGSSSNTTVNTSIFGSSSSLTISSAGVVQQAFTTASTDGNMSMTIPANTEAKNAAGNALNTLTEVINSNPPTPPSGNVIGLAIDFGPSGATFNPPITFVYQYTAADFGTGVSEVDLTLAFYDAQTGTWIDLKQKYGADYVKVDPVNDTITVLLPHFTTFAVMGKVSAPSPTPTPTPLPSPTPTPLISPIPTVSTVPSPTPSQIPSSTPTPTKTTSAIVSPGPQELMAQSSVTPSLTRTTAAAAAPAPAVSTSPPTTPAKPASTFKWELVSGILAAVIVIMAVIMVVRRKSK